MTTKRHRAEFHELVVLADKLTNDARGRHYQRKDTAIHDLVVVVTMHSDMLRDAIGVIDQLERRVARLERINDGTVS